MSVNPLKILSFRLYLSALFVSYLGTGIHFIAVAWLILELTGSNAFVGTVLGLSLLPGLFFSFPAGVYSDRYSRKWISVSADLFRFLTVAIIPLLYYFDLHSISPTFILIAEILQATATPFYTTATAGLVKEAVPSESLLAANRYKEMTLQGAALIGAGIAGFVIVKLGSYGALLLDSFTFLISALLLMFVPNSKPPIQNTKRAAVLSLAKEGLLYAKTRPLLFLFVILSVVPYLIVKSLNVVLADFVKSGLNASSVEFGWIDGAFAIGTIVGGIFLSHVNRRFGLEKTVVIFYVALVAALCLFGASQSVGLSIVSYFIIGYSVLSVKTLIGTHIQQRTENAFVGRIQGLTSALQGLVGPFMLAGSGLLADASSPRLIFFILAGCGLATALTAFVSFHTLREPIEVFAKEGL